VHQDYIADEMERFSMKIVIIDDESVICSGLKKTVESSKKEWVVSECYTDPEEALEFCDWDSVDLLLADINMPNMDGLTLVDTLRERGHDTQVVFVSGYSEFEYAKKAIQQHAIDYIIKPVSGKSLKDALIKAEQNIVQRKQLIQDESFIRDSIVKITKSFIYDVMFETRRIEEGELKETLKYCRLTNVQYSLFSFVTQEHTCRIERMVEDINKEIFLYKGSRYYYTVVLCEKRDEPTKAHTVISEMKQRLQGATFSEAVFVSNINELPSSYYHLIVMLKHAGGMDTFLDFADTDDVEDAETPNHSIHVINAIQYIKKYYSKKISLAMLSEEFICPSHIFIKSF
jgi:YesN/AraC family two-component response regulator